MMNLGGVDVKRIVKIALCLLVVFSLTTGISSFAACTFVWRDALIEDVLMRQNVVVESAGRAITSFSPNAAGQNKDHWCWAAAAKIVGVHNDVSGLPTGAVVLTDTGGLHSWNNTPFYGMNGAGQYTADAGQRCIVYYINHDDEDHTGSISNVETGLQLASLNTMNIGTWGGSSLSSTNIANINYELTHGRWVVGEAYLSTPNSFWHAIVLTSVDLSTQTYSYWDPSSNMTATFSKNNLINNNIVLASDSSTRALKSVQYCN